MLVILCLVITTACTPGGLFSLNTPNQKNNGQKSPYPIAIEDSDVRKMDGQPNLKDFDLKKYLKNQNIRIDEMEAKELMRLFIEDRFSTSRNISLVSFSSSSNFGDPVYTAVYTQLYQKYSIANGYGVLRIIMNKKGMLKQINSSIIPENELPEQLDFNKQKVLELMIGKIGREFQYNSIGGTPQIWKLTSKDEILVQNPVIYPKLIGKQISIYVAYPVIIGDGLSWTVYVDAVNGSEIDVKPNFIS